MAEVANVHIKGTADLSQANSQVKSLQAQLVALNAAAAAAGKALGYDAIALNKVFSSAVHGLNQNLIASGRYRVHTIQASTATERLGERIRRNKPLWSDYKAALSGVNKQSNIFNQLGLRQTAMMNAQAIKVGQTTHVYEKLAYTTNTAKQATMAHAQSIAATNAVLKIGTTQIVNWGKNMQWAGRQLTMGLTYPMTLFGAASAKIFKEVDMNLARLAKVYGVGLSEPTNAELNKIRENVIGLSKDLAKELGISAKETTDIAAEFAAAGLQGEQLLAATRQAARIVVLGEADKQEAVKATIALQTAYKLNTDELTEAVNFFNAAQAATSTNMQDLIGAIPRVGPVIKGLGGTYKDMVAILTALKEGGVPAGEAANAIKNSLGRIINPTKTAREELMKFGIDIQDIVNRNAGNLTATLTELQTGLLKLDDLSRQRAISELFGKYQFSRMSAFIENFNQQGSQSVKIIEMMGLAPEELANIAEKQTERLQQSASMRFKIALETFKTSLLPIGESFLNTVTTVLGALNSLVQKINELPDGVKNFLGMLAKIVMFIGPVIMFAGLFGNLIGNVLKAVLAFKVMGGALRALIGGGGREAAGVIWSLSRSFEMVTAEAVASKNPIDLFAAAGVNASNSSSGFRSSLEQLIISLQKVAAEAGVAAGSVAAVGQAASASAAGTAAAAGAATVAAGAGAAGTAAGGAVAMGTLVGDQNDGRRKKKGKGKKGPRTGGRRVNFNRRVPIVPPNANLIPITPVQHLQGQQVPEEDAKQRKLSPRAAAGGAAMLGGMAAYSAGYSTLGTSLTMAGMVPFMMAGASMPQVAAVMALVAAIPLAIKGYQNLKQAAEDAMNVVGNRFGTSAAEADMFGLKIKKLAELTLPELTIAQQDLNSRIEDYADKIKNLEEKDPLRLFAESLKDLSLESRLKALQEKYLTLRVEGLSDEDARAVIQSILKAAGVEVATIGLAPKLSEVSGRTSAEIIALQQAAAAQAAGASTGTIQTGGSKGGTQTATAGMSPTYRKVVMENAQTLGNYIVNNGMKAVEELSKLSASYRQGSEELKFFNQSVRKMYQDSGIGTEAFETLKRSGASTSEILNLFRMRMNGTITTVGQWDRALKDSAYRLSITQAQAARDQMEQAQAQLGSDISKVVKTTTAKTGQTAKQASMDDQIKKQQSYIDKLKEELATRNKILDAQNKALEFQKNKAELQQQYNQALASGNDAEAALIKRQMEIEDARYAQELVSQAKQDKIDAAEKKKGSLEERKRKLDSQVAAASKNTANTIDEVNNKYSDMVTKMLMQGKDVTSTINKWATELQSKFGGKIDDIKEKLNTFADSLKTSDLVKVGSVMAGSFDAVLNKAQQLNVVTAANKLLSTGKAVTISEAYTMALQDIMGTKMIVDWNETKGGFDIFEKGTGRGKSDAGSSGNRWFVDMFNLTDNPANRAMGGIVKKYKMGGGVRFYGPGSWGGVWGPGTSMSDSIPAMLSNGEYVVNAASVSKVGTQFMDQLNSLGYANSAPLMSIISATGSPIIPVEIARSSNSGSMYNDHSTINVYVNQTNATPDQIANAVYAGIQRRDGMVGTRTAISS